ncbi:hypothetical protein J2127_000532 [Methanococcus voltae]|uniref:hypothetical protein n=1 Tax=Methanococcus voltae TaxID=2188 RepID=UPI001AE39733|nr:hypothetical protein [Methanococcus voltae]MBP2143377.1 hypothetical protein [Methanococcus voltae]
MGKFMTSNELTITLKQHTPMIHFQHGQSGATLRGTELKPKLDKFLKKHAFDKGVEDYKTFLMGYDKEKGESNNDNEKKEYLEKIKDNAFDYRVTIKVSGENDNFDINSNPFNKLFFGNTKDKNKYKFKMYGKVELKIFSFNTELLTKIKENIESFFAITNFGTRQNKGFGSFTVERINDKDTENNFKELYKKLLEKEKKFELNENNRSKIVAVYENSEESDLKKAFEIIAYGYKNLKSGLTKQDNSNYYIRQRNLTNQYQNSLIMKHFNDSTKKTYWEKRFIKNYLKKEGTLEKLLQNIPKREDQELLKEFFKDFELYYDNANNLYNILKKETDTTNQSTNPNFKYKNVRALLGYGDTYNFIVNNTEENFQYILKALLKPTKNSDITRYKSPLTYKIIREKDKYSIYIIAKESCDYDIKEDDINKISIENLETELSIQIIKRMAKKHNNNYVRNRRGKIQYYPENKSKNVRIDTSKILNVPSDFDIKDFLDKNMPKLGYTPIGVNNDRN